MKATVDAEVVFEAKGVGVWLLKELGCPSLDCEIMADVGHALFSRSVCFKIPIYDEAILGRTHLNELLTITHHLALSILAARSVVGLIRDVGGQFSGMRVICFQIRQFNDRTFRP